MFAYTKRQQIMSDDMCLDAASPQGPVKIVRCHGMGGNQVWSYDEQVKMIDRILKNFYSHIEIVSLRQK